MAIVVGMRVIGLKNFWKYCLFLYQSKGTLLNFYVKPDGAN